MQDPAFLHGLEHDEEELDDKGDRGGGSDGAAVGPQPECPDADGIEQKGQG